VWLRIEGKIGRKKWVNRSHETHVGRVSSNLSEKLNKRFKLKLFETSRGKLSILKLWGSNLKTSETSER
jgi:hypothetical protein